MLLLLIDDDREDVELFREAISYIDESALCVTAMNGKDGLGVLKKTIPNVIFLDINMPIMDGRETLSRIRLNEALNTVPVYILSTSINGHDFDNLKNAGAAGCIIKPNSFPALCSTLKEILKRYNGK